jgi:hypothetical protein
MQFAHCENCTPNGENCTSLFHNNVPKKSDFRILNNEHPSLFIHLKTKPTVVL